MASAAEFKGKAALITGGSGGIGLRVAEQLAEAGAQVFINGRSAERGERATAKLREISPEVQIDVRNSLVDALDRSVDIRRHQRLQASDQGRLFKIVYRGRGNIH